MDLNIIFGPPGTGKTTYLLKVLSEEIKHYSLNEIAYVSFTKEGSEQGKRRAIKDLNVIETDIPYFRTLHSIAFRELKMTRSQVIEKHDYKIFSEKMGMQFTGYYTEDFRHNDDRYLFFNILYRNNPRTANSYLYDLDMNKLKFVSFNYKKFKEHYNILDFTDMIELFNKNNKALPVKVAIIDEAQDLTSLQWKMILIAFKNCDKLYVAGDDDQAIYEWSGADIKYFLNLKGNITILKKSYRLPENILNYSKNITKMILKRVDKDYHGTKEFGEVIEISNINELKIDIKETWMFLSRNRYFLKEIEDFIRKQGLIYKFKNNLSISLSKISAINFFEEIRKRKVITHAEEVKLFSNLKKNYNLLLPWYNNFNWEEKELIYYRDIIGKKTDIKKCNITINTIHSVKGAEADNIVLLLDITYQVNINLMQNPDSEHRVFYVGCTRAKKKLYIVHGNNKYQYHIYKEKENG